MPRSMQFIFAVCAKSELRLKNSSNLSRPYACLQHLALAPFGFFSVLKFSQDYWLCIFVVSLQAVQEFEQLFLDFLLHISFVA